jgi:hypothetical protein
MTRIWEKAAGAVLAVVVLMAEATPAKAGYIVGTGGGTWGSPSTSTDRT